MSTSYGRVQFFSRVLSLLCLIALSSVIASAQTVSCFGSSTLPAVRAEGLTEPVGDITLTCNGGTAGASVTMGVFVTLGTSPNLANTNITNKLDTNGAPTGISVASVAPALTGTPVVALNGATTLFIQNISYIVPVPNTTNVSIVISGIRAAAGTVTSGTSFISASLLGFGMQYAGPASFSVAQLKSGLMFSVINNGIPCDGAALPATTDFPGFLAATYSSSTLRITEGATNSFAAQAVGEDTGTRIVVKFSGYGSGVRLFVPDAIVGNDSGTPTSSGGFGFTASGGVFTPLSNQLLLTRIAGADINGMGGTPAIGLPGSTTAFTSLSEIAVSGGAAFAVYEVISSNSAVQESAQVPVFLVTSPNNCGSSIQTNIAPSFVPVSAVQTATATDPIPRFISSVPGPDCDVFGDCSGSFFPRLSADQTSLTINAASLGNSRTATFSVLNLGGAQMAFQAAITYQSGTGWLSVSPTSGVNTTLLTVTANPRTLQPATYNATIVISAGQAGQLSVPVTFVVGPAGVTIQGIVNAASFEVTRPLASGSYAAIFGLNLGGTNVKVTFNGLAGTVAYDSAGQINVILPNLGVQSNSAVIVTVDGVASDPFIVTLAPNTPGIFVPGILDSTGDVNSAVAPGKRGDWVSIYLTGLADPVTGPVTVNMGSTATGAGLIPLYAGVQGTMAGLDQVNIVIPAGLTFTGNSVPVNICVVDFTGNVCSAPVTLYVQ